MTTLNSRLQLALLNRKKAKNALAKGFTLVELMIVIVIVGILSAVALPNFLSQTGKARATEAQSAMSAAFKNAQQLYLENPSTIGSSITGTGALSGTPTEDSFNGCGSDLGLTVSDNLLGGDCSISSGVLSIQLGTPDGIVEGDITFATGAVTKPTFTANN